MDRDQIICRVLTGPTAGGKTSLSLALAEKHGWEIACMDSMQIYRGLDIGTAKPTPEERSRVPHHLLDVCDPRDSFSVTMYRDLAEALIRRRWAEDRKELLFVGGTGLYLQAMMHPMAMGTVPADEKLREELRALSLAPGGKEKLHWMLRELDPDTADRLPPNDIRRVIRAIEVSRATGMPFSRQPAGEDTSPFQWRVAVLDWPRDLLYDRINRRVRQMMDQGLEGEVRALLESGVPRESQSMQAIGYKEMIRFLDGACSREETMEEIRKATRHYAKRQLTFLRREPGAVWLDARAENLPEAAEQVFCPCEGPGPQDPSFYRADQNAT